MATIYDLSVTLRPDHLENSELKLSRVSHEEAARIFAKQHQIKVSALPHAEFFATERIELRSHLGTHLDAPCHFYPTSEGKPAKFIEEVPLDWAFGDGVVLDFRHKKPAEPITEYDIAEALEKISYTPKQGDIVALWTGGTDGYDNDPRFAESAAAMIGGALNYVFRLGVKVMATDSATVDMPIALMTRTLRQRRQGGVLPNSSSRTAYRMDPRGKARAFCQPAQALRFQVHVLPDQNLPWHRRVDSRRGDRRRMARYE